MTTSLKLIDMAATYDHIIIGAGSAGCVLARRLVDAGRTVLLLEAGPMDVRPQIHDPKKSLELWKTEVDWNYTTEPMPQLNGRRWYYPMGKVVGGSSSINGMIYMQGVPADYDQWSNQGNYGWDWVSVLPYFLRMENFSEGGSARRGIGGPLTVTKNHAINDLSRSLVEAGGPVGLPFVSDPNGDSPMGMSYTQHTISNGKRNSAWVAYVEPVLENSRLTVLTEAHFAELLFDGDRCVGVAFLINKKRYQAKATLEVILSAGAIGSPKALLLSGIGPAEQLQALNISVRHDLPGVGRNLHDHPVCPIVVEASQKPQVSVQGLEVNGYWSQYPDLPYPQIQLLSIHSGYIEGVGYSNPPIEYGFTMLSVLLHPLSRGSIRLRSKNPLDAPLIDFAVFEEPADMGSMMAGVELARNLIKQPALDDWYKSEYAPGNHVVNRDQLIEFIRNHTASSHHPVGSCRMGVDRLAVVNPELQVHGVSGLRVVDASVMPSITSGNTNAPTLMIAERAADLILGRQGRACSELGEQQ